MAPARRTRILIVDDSAVMRSLLRSVIATDPAFEMAGTAADGASALNALALNSPDLVLLDVEMPVMDGLVTLRQLRERGHKIPVIMCSSLTQRGAKVTIEALAVGASDYVAKPSGQPGREAAVRALAQELIPKIHALTRASQPCAIDPLAPRLAPAGLAASVAGPVSSALPRVVAIGVSTGGPAVLDVLLPTLPADFPLPIVIVQHMPEMFTRAFSDRLDSLCRISVKEAEANDTVLRGRALIAPGNHHLLLKRSGARYYVDIKDGPLVSRHRPSVDVLFRSAARYAGPNAVAVIMTGMGDDGASGMVEMKQAGAVTIAQDEATSVVFGMPNEAIKRGAVDLVLPLPGIAGSILAHTR